MYCLLRVYPIVYLGTHNINIATLAAFILSINYIFIHDCTNRIIIRGLR